MSQSIKKSADAFLTALSAANRAGYYRDVAQRQLDETLEIDSESRRLLAAEVLVVRETAYTKSLDVMAKAMKEVTN